MEHHSGTGHGLSANKYCGKVDVTGNTGQAVCFKGLFVVIFHVYAQKFER